ncbi:MORN_motif [Hexamita inflata]|uniref:MORN_motif n=1 Tax=Hexamita inflata TaxID=28002 RepID=A0ABP1H8J3_9EUKA
MTENPTIITENYQYIGQVINGQMHGKGVLVFNDGSYYSGQFVNNRFSGSDGTYVFLKTEMTGEFSNGDFYSGVLTHNNQQYQISNGNYKQILSQYKSNLQQEQEKIQIKNKQITIVDSNNSQKIVSFKNGIIVETIYSQVQQILVTPTYIYVGQTVNGQISGSGTLVFNDGTFYNGKFVQNRFSGSGTLQITSGTTMSGLFKDGDFISGQLQKSNSKNIEPVFEGNWKVYFPNLKIGSKLQDFYEQKQDKTQKIQVVDSTKPITEVVFYNGVLKLAQVQSPRNQTLSNCTSQQTLGTQDKFTKDNKTTPQSAKLQIGLQKDYSKVSPTIFDDLNQKTHFQNQLENEIKQLKQQNEKYTEELNKFKNEVKTAQNELIQTKMQNLKIVQEKDKIISQLQQQIQTADNEIEVKISQLTVKFQSEIQELKKTNQQLINNQKNLFNNEQLEAEVQNRIQAETRAIYEKVENIIKQKYQKALDNEIQKYIKINDELSSQLENQKQGYEEQIKDIKLQFRILEQEKRDQKQISDQQYEEKQKQFNDMLNQHNNQNQQKQQFNDFMSLNSNQNQLKQLQTEKENQEQFYRSNTLELQQQLQSQKQNFEKQVLDLANENTKFKTDYTTIQRMYELQTQILFEQEAKLKISENNLLQATQSIQEYKAKYNQQTFNDAIQSKLESQRQQFVQQLNDAIKKENEKQQELDQKNRELEKQIVRLNSELSNKDAKKLENKIESIQNENSCLSAKLQEIHNCDQQKTHDNQQVILKLKDKDKENDQLRWQIIDQQKISKNIQEISEKQNKQLKELVEDQKLQQKQLEQEIAQLIDTQQKQLQQFNERHQINVQILEQEINMLHKSSDAEQEKHLLIQEQHVKDYEYEKQQLIYKYTDEINKQLRDHQQDKQNLENKHGKQQKDMKHAFDEEKQKLVQSYNQQQSQSKTEFDQIIRENMQQYENLIFALKQQNQSTIQEYQQQLQQSKTEQQNIQVKAEQDTIQIQNEAQTKIQSETTRITTECHNKLQRVTEDFNSQNQILQLQIAKLQEQTLNYKEQEEQLIVQQRIHTDNIHQLQAMLQQLQYNINQFEDQKAIYLNVALNKKLNSENIKTIVQLLNQQDALNVLLTQTLQKVDPSYCAPKPLEIDQMQEEIQTNKQKLGQQNELYYYETIREEFKVECKRLITEFKFNEKLELQLPEQIEINNNGEGKNQMKLARKNDEEDKKKPTNNTVKIIIDMKDYPEDTGTKLIKIINKQLPTMISAEVQEDLNVMVIVKKENSEETAKAIRKLKIKDKRLICWILESESYLLESVINISISESEDQSHVYSQSEEENELKQNIQTRILIDLKEFPEETGQKLIKYLKKQIPKMINAQVTEENNVMVIVKQKDTEETAKIIRKLKIDNKRLNCQIIDQSPNQPVLESVINISISESEAQVKDKQILIDLKEFPEDTAPKLIKTLKKQIPEMITADVMEDLNVLVTAKQEDVEETAKTIRRLKVLEKRLNCTIVNKNDKKDEKKKTNIK